LEPAPTPALEIIVKKEPNVSDVSIESAALISYQQEEGSLNCRKEPNCSQVKEETCPWRTEIKSLIRSSSVWKDALMNFVNENLTRIPPEIIEIIVKLLQDQELSDSEDAEEMLDLFSVEIRSRFQTPTLPHM
jgi:hypothetical protein